jgi:lysozyme family protein
MIPLDYFNLILDRFEKPALVRERGIRSFGGVNEMHHPKWAGWKRIDEGNTEGIRNDLVRFYDKYWDDTKSGLLPRPVDLFHFDFSFNSGTDAATRELQRLINRFEHVPALVVDGVVGPATAREVLKFSRLPGYRLGARYLISRLIYLSKLGDLWVTNGDGWTKRVGKLTGYL